MGGGLVKGSAILVGGEPGIGKSTLLLQLADKLSDNKIYYITGEESFNQISIRAKRINVKSDNIQISTHTKVEDIVLTLKKEKPDLLIIDSIQTIFLSAIEAAPGTVTQVRNCAFSLISICKELGITLILVGHVTKEGQIAGPKVLEHMVDTVLYFENDKGNNYRILRSVKNRYGAANEIALFSMHSDGLKEINNPSEIFIENLASSHAGSVIFPAIEGSRTVLVEIQALIAPTFMNIPRRSVVGWDQNRLSMLLAVLYNSCNISLADKEVYLNVAGGFKISETAADLAVIAALISAIKKTPIAKKIGQKTIICGEVGLSGEIRSIAQIDKRVKEAKKLGFKHVISPKFEQKPIKDFTITNISNIEELLELI